MKEVNKGTWRRDKRQKDTEGERKRYGRLVTYDLQFQFSRIVASFMFRCKFFCQNENEKRKKGIVFLHYSLVSGNKMTNFQKKK
jgi:hypothetical protein